MKRSFGMTAVLFMAVLNGQMEYAHADVEYQMGGAYLYGLVEGFFANPCWGTTWKQL